MQSYFFPVCNFTENQRAVHKSMAPTFVQMVKQTWTNTRHFPETTRETKAVKPAVPMKDKSHHRQRLTGAWAQTRHRSLGESRAPSTRRNAWKRPSFLCLKLLREESYFSGNDSATWRIRFKQNLQQRLHYLFSEVFIHWNVLRLLPSIWRKEIGLM